MRAELRRILDSYEDFELAFLQKFKLNTYLEDTQSEILHYIRKERGLSSIAIDDLVMQYQAKEFTDNVPRCPRCKSAKIINTDEEFWRTGEQPGFYDEAAALDGLVGKSHYVKKQVCSICDYVLQDLNNQVGFWQRFRRALKEKIKRYVKKRGYE